MGYGLPAAIGGCLGGDRRRTISVDGDGGCDEYSRVEVVKRLNLPIKFFVLKKTMAMPRSEHRRPDISSERSALIRLRIDLAGHMQVGWRFWHRYPAHPGPVRVATSYTASAGL